MNKIILMLLFFVISFSLSHAQIIQFEGYQVQPINAFVSSDSLMDKREIKVIKDPSIQAVDEPTFARLNDIYFLNGIIKVKVFSRLLKTAPGYTRGFIGIASRINDSHTKYESIYIRPVNARVEDQVRRNHSIQYYSYPDYKFDRLRKESPERYEFYADMEMNKWIRMRIEVKGALAKLFLNNNEQPALIVNDLKHGANMPGAIGLWVEVGTEGYFSDIKVTKQD